MESMQPTLKRGRDVWDEIRMPESEFRVRVEKLTREMRKRHIRVLLLYGNGQNDYGHPCYITNYLTKMPQGAMAVVTDKGEVALICEGFARDAAMILTTTWVKEVRSGADVSSMCVTYLKEKKLIPSTIGFVGLHQMMPYRQFQFLSESLKQCKMVDVEDLMKRMRMIKSERESDQIRRSARIVGQGFDFISRTSFPHFNEKILEAAVGRLAYLEGAEDVRILIGRPKETTWSLRPSEDIPLQEGDTVNVFIAVEFERYWSEGIRTYVFKGNTLKEPASPDSKKLYEKVMQGLAREKSVSTFCKETMRRIKRSKADCLTDYGLGGGIGLSLKEFPAITGDDNTVLKQGMCTTLRLTIRQPELGVIMTGDTVHLIKDGVETLTRH